MSNDAMPFVNGVARWVFFLQMRNALAVIIYRLFLVASNHLLEDCSENSSRSRTRPPEMLRVRCLWCSRVIKEVVLAQTHLFPSSL